MFAQLHTLCTGSYAPCSDIPITADVNSDEKYVLVHANKD